jgi:predicted aspartyl protease
MPVYDAIQFQPPAPIANVTLRNGSTGAVALDVPMLIDTGADVTLIPRTVLDTLGSDIISNSTYELVGFNSSKSVAQVVHVELVFCRRIFRGQFLLVDQLYGILGRNVLNAVPLLLNGPQFTWDEHR